MAKSAGLDTADVVAAFEKCGDVSKTALYLGVTRSTVRQHLDKTGIRSKLAFAGGSLDGVNLEQKRALPQDDVIARYVLTCAQSNTYVAESVWETILGIAKYYNAEILVSRFTYNKSAYLKYWGGTQKAGKPDDSDEDISTEGASDATLLRDKGWFDPRVQPYYCDKRVELAPGLVFCGELNILPTAVRPLSGLEGYTGRKSTIVPHVKIALDCVASGKHEPTKFMYTTGTVTKKNYIQKKEGQKAEFHHCYGALLVEVNSSGDWWVRQLNADRRGRIYDLGDRQDGVLLFHGKSVKKKQRVEAINWGDIHVQELDKASRDVNWAEGGFIDLLRPRYQFGHDTFSFVSRNHHDEKNCHRNFQKHVEGIDSVLDELRTTAHFLEVAHREGTEFVLVDSNHDRALTKWLQLADYRVDPRNAEIFLELQARVYRGLREKDENFHLLEYALRAYGGPLMSRVRFLREDESFVICRDSSGGIECGDHGHLGPNGSRGAPLAFSKMARRGNRGHTHIASIIDGGYTAGVTGKPKNFSYLRGPGAWSQSDIVTYPNGKRQIVTKWRNKYRAA
jgi:hypothetical protein